MDSDTPPSRELVTEALWGACHGGQRKTAELLLDRGGDLNWIGWSGRTPLDAALDGEHVALAEWLRERGARESTGEREP